MRRGMKPELNLPRGHVLCPPCSGTGCYDGKARRRDTVTGQIVGDCVQCRLCKGSGDLTRLRAERFWECWKGQLAQRRAPQPGDCLSV